MSMPERLAVVMALALQLVAPSAARADTGGGANQGKSEHRTKPIRLDLTWAWPQPAGPPPIPPVGGAAVPPPAPQAPRADGAQIAMAVLITLVGDAAGLLVAGGTDSLWAGAIPWVITPFGAAALVCNAGSAAPGRCRATLTGALIGAAVGLLPGILILASAGSRPDTEDAYHTYIQNRLTGFEATFVLYGIGVPLGAVIGYNAGGAASSNPTTMPPIAAVPVFSLRF